MEAAVLTQGLPYRHWSLLGGMEMALQKRAPLRCELQVIPGRSQQGTGVGGRLWLLWLGGGGPSTCSPQPLNSCSPSQWLSVCCFPEVLLHGVQCQQKRCCAEEVVQLQNFAPELISLFISKLNLRIHSQGQDRKCAFLNSLGLIADHFFKHLKKH